MTKNNLTFMESLKPFLKNEGFNKSKKTSTWFKKDKNNTFFIINLDKSRWSSSYYINIGFKFPGCITNDDWTDNKPNIDYCTLAARAEKFSLFKEDKEFVYKLGAGGIPNDSPEDLINDVLEYIRIFFKQNKSKNDFIKNYKFEGSRFESYIRWLGENCEKIES